MSDQPEPETTEILLPDDESDTAEPAPSDDPEQIAIPSDHPLAFLGGPFRLLASHIVALEDRLKKVEGG